MKPFKRIHSDILSEAVKMTIPDRNKEISKDQFLAYESVRQSGITNMWDVKVVEQLSGLRKETIFKIMKSYTELAKKYLEVK